MTVYDSMTTSSLPVFQLVSDRLVHINYTVLELPADVQARTLPPPLPLACSAAHGRRWWPAAATAGQRCSVAPALLFSFCCEAK
jgi:hypothetical protein